MKKILLFLILFSIISFNIKTVSAVSNSKTGDQITNISNLIKEKTPDFIQKPIISVATKVEAFRVKHNFKNKLWFYGVSIAVFLLILGFIWSRFL